MEIRFACEMALQKCRDIEEAGTMFRALRQLLKEVEDLKKKVGDGFKQNDDNDVNVIVEGMDNLDI